ncbi:MAG: hypothetical protein VW949_10515 [Paracoccaceae bacterium]
MFLSPDVLLVLVAFNLPFIFWDLVVIAFVLHKNVAIKTKPARWVKRPGRNGDALFLIMFVKEATATFCAKAPVGKLR